MDSDFFPSEAEEEACKVNNTPWKWPATFEYILRSRKRLPATKPLSLLLHIQLLLSTPPQFTYHPRPGNVFIERNTGTKYVGINYVQLLHTHNHNTFDLIYKACYYTSDWIHNDSLLPSGYATVKFIRPSQDVPWSIEAGQSIHNSNIINVEKWVIQKFQGGYCVALPYMSEGSLRYILSTRFNNGLPEDCIAIALKQAFLGLFDLHNLGLIHKRFSAGNIYVNFKQTPISEVEIKLGFAATIYD
ncbi:hypothetical protein MTR67_024359 [Solanum verrucosum]|uniref:Protein kinase domain-containing protein n=1 Tax=Solanum verrucosum TaxID=315347 RepID=A0AAF0QV75_SOLVR|nr:hypothetical protein MTR67_024359 [Solanum verrucosum]